MRRLLSPWFLVLAAILASRFIGMALFPFADTTEPRYAEIARLMAETGDWITPWFEPGVPFWGKPPLSFWAQAASIKLFGVSEFAIRLPAWLATLGIVYLTWHFALLLWGKAAARWSALVFSSMALTYISAGAVMTDAFLVLGTTLSLVSFGLVMNGHVRYWRSLFFVGLAIGLLAKGPLAPVLVGIPIGLWFLLIRTSLAKLRHFPLFWGSILTVCAVLPWYILAEWKTPGFLDYFIIGEHFRRFVDPGWAGDLYGSAHVQPKGMIWIFWTWASFPWGIIAISGLVISWIRRGTARESVRALRDPALLFVLLATISPLLFFSMAGNTLWTYALPSLPFSAILIARWLISLDLAWFKRFRWPLAGTVPVLLTIFVVLVTQGVATPKTEKQMVLKYQELAQVQSSPLFYLGDLPFSARYYSRGTAQELAPEELPATISNSEYETYFIAVPKNWEPVWAEQWIEDARTEATNRRYRLLSFSGTNHRQELSQNDQ